MLKIKQYFCKHDFYRIAEHEHVKQNLWECSKCRVYCIQQWGIGTHYFCKKQNITGWKYIGGFCSKGESENDSRRID